MNLLRHHRFLTSRPGRSRLILCLLSAVLGCGAAAFGQEADSEKPAAPPTPKTHPRDPMAWSVDQMMDDAVQQIVRRYNLNRAQEAYTRLLLRRRVLEFLDTHEDSVRQLLKESIDFRWGQQKRSPDALQDWAVRAAPIYEAARDAILTGNEEWGKILNDDQKKIHERDLAQMDTSFANVDRVLGNMKAGKGMSGRPKGQTAQSDGRLTANPVVVHRQFMEANWLAYVERFILTYKFDEKQQNAARAKIHKEFHTRARAYRERKKDDFAKIEEKLGSITAGPSKAQEARELRQGRADLEKPIRRMFVDMDRRLKMLRRAEQSAKADPAQKTLLERMYDRLAGNLDDKRRAVSGVKNRPDAVASETVTGGPTSKPAGAEPAQAKQADPKKAKSDRTGGKTDTTSEAAKPKASDPAKSPAGKPKRPSKAATQPSSKKPKRP